MKVTDLSGKIHNLNVAQYVSLKNRARSAPHLKAREMLKKLYPYDLVAEEVAIPGEHLFMDFFIPTRMICVEVQGQQHRGLSAFYHGNMQGFMKSQARDLRKVEWCEINGFTLITLDDNEKEEVWEQKLLRRQQTTTE